MISGIREAVHRAAANPAAGMVELPELIRQCLAAGDFESATPLSLALLMLMAENGLATPPVRDCVEWLVSKDDSVRTMERVESFATAINDEELARRARARAAELQKPK